MEIKNNFISSITLGNFNPAILTPMFLSNACGFNLKDPPKGQTMPVVSNISFGDISFLVDLERMQIMHKSVQDFQSTPIIGFLKRYLEILPYTPVTISGINFNCDVIGFDFTNLKRIINSDRSIAKILKTNEYFVNSRYLYKSGKEKYLLWDLSLKAGENVFYKLTFYNKDNICTFNYNYEVHNLERERALLSNITDKFNNLIERYEYIKNKIMEIK